MTAASHTMVAVTAARTSTDPFDVLIGGGGVAALEAALASLELVFLDGFAVSTAGRDEVDVEFATSSWRASPGFEQ
jgi:hypothetical protein